MILSGLTIKRKIQEKKIVIEPFHEKKINPNSYNLTLHDELVVYKKNELDMKYSHETEIIQIPKDGIMLKPNILYLGRTSEYTETHEHVPMLEGRSSIGRLGLFIHITAGFGDVGFCGYWTLEIMCIHPIRIYPDIDICQIFYHQIDGEYKKYESTKYQNNKGIQASQLYKDFENE